MYGKNNLRGWVYVITNKSLPGLVKIGFSSKDPSLRARQFDEAALPHPYEVVYDILVANPFQMEQTIHRYLKSAGLHEKKEWFRCSESEAIDVIRRIADNKHITEKINISFNSIKKMPLSPISHSKSGRCACGVYFNVIYEKKEKIWVCPKCRRQIIIPPC